MPTITLELPVADTEAQAGLIATNFSDLQTLLNGGLDNANVSTTADLDATARVGVRKNSAGSTFERRRLNLIEGSGITLTVADDSANEEVDVTIASGSELAYQEKTSSTSITATTAGTADTVVTAPAVTFDGSTIVLIEFCATRVRPGTTNIIVGLWQDGSMIGILSMQGMGDAGATFPDTACYGARRMTPAAGSRTYSVRAYVDGGTGVVIAGAGGSATDFPCFIRITRA